MKFRITTPVVIAALGVAAAIALLLMPRPNPPSRSHPIPPGILRWEDRLDHKHPGPGSYPW